MKILKQGNSFWLLSSLLIALLGSPFKLAAETFWYRVVNDEVTITGYAGTEETVIVPDTVDGLPVTRIGVEAFLESDSVSTFSRMRGVLFDKERATLLIYPPGKRGEYYVPGSVSTIADYAFAYTVELATIRFDEGLETIGNRAFLNSSSLESVVLPASVVSLGEQAFAGCPELEHVYFKGNAPVHGDNFFDNGAEQAVVYYQLGGSGWESRYGGLPTIEWDPEATYAAWIASYSLDEHEMGLQDDPDHDGQPNGMENLFGTNPTQASAGLVVVEIGETTTFVHPYNAASAKDLVLAYQWSLDLRQFYNADSYDDAGLTRVAFSTQLDTPSAGLATVAASINGSELPRRIFVRIQATQDPVF
ncbi:leucine-rich repeat domain-containing protein [Pelagicoccus sp. SDUM812002]|uniref:leucine-rich repeat domain-containing protein n=1 Tax=Pelagicoccus sp. SDUM812002 TaxID=3041266 RepID=UPI0028100D84|nr:leucine-rich repeat domain-containing protein [Pelagicoccus sp. SDUM812002]MDQ8187421.1 leucine-rich repeat domain-containing protein [Pelagicoccus sp. SDUM812002]